MSHSFTKVFLSVLSSKPSLSQPNLICLKAAWAAAEFNASLNELWLTCKMTHRKNFYFCHLVSSAFVFQLNASWVWAEARVCFYFMSQIKIKSRVWIIKVSGTSLDTFNSSKRSPEYSQSNHEDTLVPKCYRKIKWPEFLVGPNSSAFKQHISLK